jgi:hypothetical protein
MLPTEKRMINEGYWPKWGTSTIDKKRGSHPAECDPETKTSSPIPQISSRTVSGDVLQGKLVIPIRACWMV